VPVRGRDSNHSATTKPFLLALPPRRAAELAVAFADATDRRIAALSDDDVPRNAAAGHPINLLRASTDDNTSASSNAHCTAD
jgi:hypothetical protein